MTNYHPLAALIAGVKVKPLEWELRANKEGVVYCAYDPLYGREVEAPNERTCDAIDQDRTARILAALEAAPVPDLVEVGPPFFFDRYINGVRMAEDVCVERETTLEGAIHVAARIAAKGPNGEPPVLVYRHTETAALIALATAQAAQIAGLEAKARESAMQELASLGQAQEAYEAQVAAETALAAERAKVARLVEALKPFAEYMADGGDKNYEGDLLPDTEGVGWVYLTVGDFRRARAAIKEAGQ